MDLALTVFVAVYLVMILGRVPGLRMDRTGAALFGAIALIAGGAVGSEDAWRAIDVGTIGLLFGLMVVSAQFRLGGFYTRITRWLAARPTSPRRLLFELMLVTGLLSAVLTNDVVCLAVAPVLVDTALRRKLDPVPFLLGLAAASNIGSAATLIGNPQNMLIGQSLHLPFAPFLLDAAPPALLGLVAAWWILARAYRGAFERAVIAIDLPPDLPFHRWHTTKGLCVLVALAALLIASPLPREVLALLAGGILLLSRTMATRDLMQLVDWPLLVLFAGLFVTNHAFVAAGHSSAMVTGLQHAGVDLNSAPTLFATAAIGSNVVSNVPWTMLLLPTATHPLAGPILALATTLAGNLLLIGSIANLIVVEQAVRLGVHPRNCGWGMAQARTGIPITVVTLGLAAGWLWLRS